MQFNQSLGKASVARPVATSLASEACCTTNPFLQASSESIRGASVAAMSEACENLRRWCVTGGLPRSDVDLRPLAAFCRAAGFGSVEPRLSPALTSQTNRRTLAAVKPRLTLKRARGL